MEWRLWLTVYAPVLACWITPQHTTRSMITPEQTQFLAKVLEQISASLQKKFGAQLTPQDCEDLAKNALICGEQTFSLILGLH